MGKTNINTATFKVPPAKSIRLRDYQPDYREGIDGKEEAKEQLNTDIQSLMQLQYKLYAENKQSLLIVFQAMDAAGKDSAIKHVFRGVNPQGCVVHSFKTPSANELEHDFLWRHYCCLPRRGNIGIFNRSHYENVLITKVHPEYILNENLKDIKTVDDIDETFWEKRYKQINAFEKTISENGTRIVKLFLNLSKEKQKKRFLKRIDDETKNWKFSKNDIAERAYWDAYQAAYERALNKTSTDLAPWYIIPADKKWYARVVIGRILVDTLESMDIKIPELSDQAKESLIDVRQKLVDEKS
jgi:PPK2 family polyphosphate:nucleotide phosphotransferase